MRKSPKHTTTAVAPPMSFVAPDVNSVLLPVVIADTPTVQCKRCLQFLPQTEEYFYRHHKRNWWQSWCRECQKARMTEIRAARKKEPTSVPALSSPRANATLKYLRQQLDIIFKEEIEALTTLTAIRDARVRIEQAIVAMIGSEAV